jgi:hypothetical protein
MPCAVVLTLSAALFGTAVHAVSPLASLADVAAAMIEVEGEGA